MMTLIKPRMLLIMISVAGLRWSRGGERSLPGCQPSNFPLHRINVTALITIITFITLITIITFINFTTSTNGDSP